MQQVPVSDLTRQCPEAFICETALVRQAAELLVVHNLTVLIVQNTDGGVVGVLPEATIIRHLMQTTHRDEIVARLMSRHVETVRAEADLSSVLHLFRSSCHAVVPVVDGTGLYVGILHRSDVVRHLLTEINERVDSSRTMPESTQGRKPHFFKRPEAQQQQPQDSDSSKNASQD